MVARPSIALVSLFFTAGAALLIFLVLLAGAVDHHPVSGIWFLRVDTSGIKGAPSMSHWTFWNVCDGSSGINANCGKVVPAYPFDPPRDFGTTNGIPSAFIGTHKFYYLSRFFFALTLIGLFFAVISLFVGIGAMCFRIGGLLSGIVVSFALFWQFVAATLMTACFVIGRNDFRNNGTSAGLGQEAFGFMWAAAACLLISTVLYFSILSTCRRESSRGGRRFGRKRNLNRNRGSFIDHERGLKDDETTSFERSR